MADDHEVDVFRRRFLTGTATVIGGAGAALAAIPFLASFQPSAKAKALGAPVEVALGALEPGQRIVEKWRGKPVWIIRRSPAMLDGLQVERAEILRDPESTDSVQPAYAANTLRSIKPEYLILLGVCTHLSCAPQYRPGTTTEGLGEDWLGGFFCTCHGSKFDLAGRVYKGVPAPTNLEVPPHRFIDDTHIIIGEDQEDTA